MFVGPHQPYLVYVGDVLPSLGEEGVQICTLRDLVTEGAAAAIETDPNVARLKSSVDMVDAIEAAVTFYEEPPTTAMTVSTHWSDVALTANDWAEAFEAPDPGTPHNAARDQIWEALVAILIDKHDSPDVDGDVTPDLLRKSLLQNTELRATFNRAWPLLEAGELVADLWSVPAYLRKCAPWLSSDDVRQLQRADAARLDGVRPAAAGRGPAAARRSASGPAAASERGRRRSAARADGAGRGQLDRGRRRRVRQWSGDDAARRRLPRRPGRRGRPGRRPRDELAGPFAHIVVDEAQELTDAEWQMVLLPLPVPEFHHRRGPRPGQARIHRVVAGTARANRARPDHSGLAEHQLPDTGRSHGGSRAGHPSSTTGRQRADLDPQQQPSRHPRIRLGPALDRGHLARRARRRNRLRHRRSHLRGTSRVRSLTPELSKGLEFDLVVLIDPEEFGDGIEGAVDRYVAMTRATQQLVILASS